jgi:hypothetical protein
MFRNLQLATAICLLALTNNVHADAIAISGLSWHASNHGGNTYFNEENPGLGYEHGLNETHTLAVGFYYNSSKRETDYLLDFWQPFQWTPDIGKIKFGVAMGLVSGYDGNDFMPTAVPMLSYENRIWGVNLVTLTFPTHPLVERSVFAVQLKINIP